MSDDPRGEECNPPGSVEPSAEEKEMACVICGKRMYYAEEFRVNVCLNESHGVLAYYGPDRCYFTSREEIGLMFAKEGKKFHMIEASVLKMMSPGL